MFIPYVYSSDGCIMYLTSFDFHYDENKDKFVVEYANFKPVSIDDAVHINDQELLLSLFLYVRKTCRRIKFSFALY